MAPQDSFIDEGDEVCPLCIEEFDLSDLNFTPCPCGYKVCQFCFNNIKNNMNGLCPACRRPYDEKTIGWKVVTVEEVTEFRANITKNQKRRAQEQRQKEVQKREAEKENRKNLIGVRVVQKNLVYITGLAPTVRKDELLKTLRKPEFFGQYGSIQKISISNRNSHDNQFHPLGIYVTFEKPEEADKCILAVHGSQNGDRILKAQHGTTKYCSAWLKNEKCGNPGCMFLHEQGDEEDSYTRQDLSSMNSIHTQRPLPGGGTTSMRTSRSQDPQPTPPPPPSAPPVSQSMAASLSKDGLDNGVDSSALPSSANWARNVQTSRRGSLATSGAASTPPVTSALPATAEVQEAEALRISTPQEQSSSKSESEGERKSERSQFDLWFKTILVDMSNMTLPSMDKALLDVSPPLFDVNGGAKRRAMRDEEDARLAAGQDDQADIPDSSEGEAELEAGGSFMLGGEPEEREGSENLGFDQRRSTQLPIQRSSTDTLFGPALGTPGLGQPSTNPIGRTMTPQQLFSLRSQSGFGNDMPPGISHPNNGFSGQSHSRQSSRFSFANDSGASSSNIKLATKPRNMAQQSSMLPSSFQGQSGSQYFSASSVPGPPPGLKSTGTPPAMFGQGFGGPGFNVAAKDSSNDLLHTLISRNRAGVPPAHDAGKHDELPSLLEAAQSVDALVSDDTHDANAMGASVRTPISSSTSPGFDAAADGTKFGARTSPLTKNVQFATPSELSMPTSGLVQETAAAESDSHKANDRKQVANRGETQKATERDLKMMGPSQQTSNLQEEDFPALVSLKETPVSPRKTLALTVKNAPALKKTSQKANKPVEVTTNTAPAVEPATHRQASREDRMSGKENSIMLPKRAATGKKQKQTGVADVEEVFGNPSSDSVVEHGNGFDSRLGPKTLRIVPTTTTKTDAPPLPSPPSTSSKGNSLTQRSRTPASEIISDTASVISSSLSLSRAGSPPPNGIVGSAGLRSTTKSQQRKQRKEVSKQETKVIAEITKEAVEHAPVLGRKKKQKKEKASKSVIPKSTSASQETNKVKDDAGEPMDMHLDNTKMKQAALGSSQMQKRERKGSADEEETSPAISSTSKEAPTSGVLPPGSSQLDPFSIFAKLRHSLPVSALDKLHIFKPLGALSKEVLAQPDLDIVPSGSCNEGQCQCTQIQKSDAEDLQAGKAVRKQYHDSKIRLLITPNGDCVRGLSREEEDAFLELQAAIASAANHPGAFVAPRHQTGQGAFSIIRGRAVPNGRPTIFPTHPFPTHRQNDVTPADSIMKLQREDALSYINQYVLPRLSLGLAKGSGSSHDAAAASLNSLAPYFYGPDAAAGVGIYSPSEGTRGVSDFGSAAIGSSPAIYLGDDHPTKQYIPSTAPGAFTFASSMAMPSGPSSVPLMSVEEAEAAVSAARKETEMIEKGLNALIKRNRRLVLGVRS